jgi:hypothetical protein
MSRNLLVHSLEARESNIRGQESLEGHLAFSSCGEVKRQEEAKERQNRLNLSFYKYITSTIMNSLLGKSLNS